MNQTLTLKMADTTCYDRLLPITINYMGEIEFQLSQQVVFRVSFSRPLFIFMYGKRDGT